MAWRDYVNLGSVHEGRANRMIGIFCISYRLSLSSLLLRAGIGVEVEGSDAGILGLLYNGSLSSVGGRLVVGQLGRFDGALGLELSSLGRHVALSSAARRRLLRRRRVSSRVRCSIDSVGYIDFGS